ncbi:hypothetical protein EI545_07710 [Tabrizicola piscis]|uniref:Uncharacterized protein n=1 Tax=Tabrizicola piscis TaxID=2494374 RepID=A0A3S8U544_9RHOB|nr:hypothetical protein [Tabrizicola piscis]AZL58734.1 hypothetical protein EI545_07710 [Tabrizicola piscis]
MSRIFTCMIVLTAATAAFALPASAKIVAEPKLAQYCGEEAASRLGVAAASLLLLPVEKTHGTFYVYGQTDETSPTLFSCTFDGKRSFLGIEIEGDHDHGTHADAGAPKAAMNKCLQIFGLPAKVETVSDFGNGFYEIILQSKANARKVACTVPADGSVIEDWVEMN